MIDIWNEMPYYVWYIFILSLLFVLGFIFTNYETKTTENRDEYFTYVHPCHKHHFEPHPNCVVTQLLCGLALLFYGYLKTDSELRDI